MIIRGAGRRMDQCHNLNGSVCVQSCLSSPLRILHFFAMLAELLLAFTLPDHAVFHTGVFDPGIVHPAPPQGMLQWW